jgi:alpha-tubulin suppressor-like RCC1 family protein
LFTAGKGANGHLGDGVAGTQNRNVPTQISTGITNWANAFGANEVMFATTEDGKMYAWGSTAEGEFGRGTKTQNLTVPTQVGSATDWKFVAVGGEHCIGLKTNGTIWSTGHGGNGDLGHGNETSLSTWTQIGTDTNWCHVVAGTQTSGALKTDGTMYMWGNGNNGRSGNGNAVHSSVPTQVGTDSNWYDMACGLTSIQAIKLDGTAYGWGQQTIGQLGIHSVLDTSVPVQIGSLDTWARTFDTDGQKHFLAKSARAAGVGNTTRLWYDL